MVAAAYLARAGLRVVVLERRGGLGGAAVSERPFAGHAARLSRYAYLVSLLPARIARDLGVRVELRPRRVRAFAPPALLLGGGPAGEAAERSLGTGGDPLAAATAAARRLFATVTEPLPTRAQAEWLVAGLPGAWEALAERPLGETLRERVEDPLLRGIVATDALIGTFASLFDASLRQNRCWLWHMAGGPWRVPAGGMGALSDALAAAARRAGAELRTRAEVLAVDGTAVTWREGGAEHALDAGWVLHNAAPGRAAAHPAEGSQLKVNMLLDRLPRLRSGVAPEDAFAGTFHLDESEPQLEAAYAEAAAGRLPARPPAELYCHSLTDRSILGPDAPPGRHTLTLFGLHAPARLFAGEDGGRAARDALVDRTLDALDEHLADPIRDCLARDAGGRPCLEAMSPVDLERELGLPGGHIFHGDLEWPWAQGGGWGVETEHPRVVRAGASARRGGGVSGIAGHNAAMHVLAHSGAGGGRIG